MTGPAITFDAVRFAWPGGAPMQFDVTFPAGTVTAVMGPSGSGKSTLLGLVAGFETPRSGRVIFGDAEVTALPPWERPLSVVFQENNLFAHLDAVTNVALGISADGSRSREVLAAAEAALASVGLEGYGRRLPGSMSGGERQRVALARVLARARPVLLLDEAFASLGPGLRDDMLNLVADLQRAHAMTVVMVTHEPADANRIAGRIVFVDRGRIEASGPVHEFLGENAPEKVRAYLGRLRSGDA